jgi:subtilisin family serine protease
MASRKRNPIINLFPYEREDILTIQEVKQQAGWNVTAFELPSAWTLSQGEGVTIAVLDSGCDLEHPDLVDNLLEGKNFVDPSQPPFDDNGHGTHITGTLVASNNEIGVVGVAPKAKVRPVKCLDAEGSGNMNRIAEAIRWAADQGVDFISMSIGCPMPVKQIRLAVQYAISKGCVFFCAAGNVGNTKEVFYPAAYPETIAIGAVDESMRRAKFSNTGHNLDFMAPGVDILSTVPESWYAKLSGTSMAAPFACGVAALVLSYKRQHNLERKLETADDYREMFKKYTTPINNGNYDDPQFYQGFGIIDPRKYFQTLKT